jgi:hypothetical protein
MPEQQGPEQGHRRRHPYGRAAHRRSSGRHAADPGPSWGELRRPTSPGWPERRPWFARHRLIKAGLLVGLLAGVGVGIGMHLPKPAQPSPVVTVPAGGRAPAPDDGSDGGSAPVPPSPGAADTRSPAPTPSPSPSPTSSPRRTASPQAVSPPRETPSSRPLARPVPAPERALRVPGLDRAELPRAPRSPGSVVERARPRPRVAPSRAATPRTSPTPTKAPRADARPEPPTQPPPPDGLDAAPPDQSDPCHLLPVWQRPYCYAALRLR